MKKILKTFNEDLQVDYLFVPELTKDPLIHFKDSATGFCSAVRAPSRDMDVAGRLFEMYWINVNGPPEKVSADPEFDNQDFKFFTKKHNVQYNARPARRHNKMGAVESANFTLRILIQRILKDSEHYRETRGTQFTPDEILSRAVFLSNVLYGQKKMSPFELARGYRPVIGDLHQKPVESSIAKAHHEQIARRALHRLLASKNPSTLSKYIDSENPSVFFREVSKFWKLEGWIRARN